MQSGQHIVSLSLGTVAEPSAVVVIEPRTEFWRSKDPEDNKRDSENHFAVTHLERFPAGHPLPVIVGRVSESVSDKRLAKRCHLLLDCTSTGAAPLRVFESRGFYPESFDLTNAGIDERTGPLHRVPLRDVIGAAQVVLQMKRLKVASALDLASTLVGDLQTFDPKPLARGLDLRGGRNSDLVFAVAVALWWADRLTWGDDAAERSRPTDYSGPTGWMAR